MKTKSFLLTSSAVLLMCTYAQAEADCNPPQMSCPSTPAATSAAAPAQKPMASMMGEPLNCGCPAAYNAPATITTCQQYPVYGTFSFLYWYGAEEGLSLATNGILSAGVLELPSYSKTLFQSFNYKPGFKIGMGYTGEHEWTLYTEYTWLRGSNSVHKNAPSLPITTAGSSVLTGSPVWVVNDWFIQPSPSFQGLSGSRVSSKWHYAVDFLDAVASRPFYQGPRVTVSPFAGLRAAWIRQSMKVSLTEDPSLFTTNTPPQPINSHSNSTSWGIGPRGGLNSYSLLPMGFRFEGNLAANLLYMSYEVGHDEDSPSTAFNPLYTAKWNSYGCLRPIVECGLGLGWGMYLDGMRYHIDCSADYDFTYLWDQNMMRKLIDNTMTATSPSTGALYFHGLTLSSRFDF